MLFGYGCGRCMASGDYLRHYDADRCNKILDGRYNTPIKIGLLSVIVQVLGCGCVYVRLSVRVCVCVC